MLQFAKVQATDKAIAQVCHVQYETTNLRASKEDLKISKYAKHFYNLVQKIGIHNTVVKSIYNRKRA